MLKHAIVIAVSGSLLVGCADTVRENPNTAGGALIGALGGAAIGTLFGGSDRRNALVGAGVGLLAGAAVGQYMDRQERELQNDLAGTGAVVTRDGDALLVNFPSNVTFAVDSSQIRPEFYNTLDDVSVTLNRYPQSYLDIVGHTDSTGTEAYNQSLSERRAGSVSGYFRGRGVDPVRIASYGAGDERAPVGGSARSFFRSGGIGRCVVTMWFL